MKSINAKFSTENKKIGTSKVAESFRKMWAKNWEKLLYNPYYNLICNLDIDSWNDFGLILDNMVCSQYTEAEYEHIMDWQEPVFALKKLLSEYKKEYQEILSFAFKGHADYINSYLEEHNIQLINTGRDEWKIIRFVDYFLGDFGSDKVVFLHERYDGESGEFVMFDLSFVKECVKNNKIPDPPKVKIDRKWKKLARSLEDQEKQGSGSLI